MTLGRGLGATCWLDGGLLGLPSNFFKEVGIFCRVKPIGLRPAVIICDVPAELIEHITDFSSFCCSGDRAVKSQPAPKDIKASCNRDLQSSWIIILPVSLIVQS